MPSNYWGLLGLVCFDALFLFSTEWCRKNVYNLFLTTHVMSFSVLFPAVRAPIMLNIICND